LVLALVTIAFGAILLPFYGAVFWAVILAIIFAPLHRRLQRLCGKRRNLAAFLSLLVCILIAVLPVIVISASLIQQVTQVYEQIRAALPESAQELLARYGAGDFTELRQRLSQAVLAASQMLANRAVAIGQNTFQFIVGFAVMLYLLFFFFRDGSYLARTIRDAVPLEESRKRQLFAKFTTVVRATVKGNVIIAVTQGVLGGMIFWVLGIQGALLWGVVMAFLSLLPAVGAGLVW